MKHNPLFPVLLLLALLLPSAAQAARDKDLVPMADSLTHYLTEKTSVRSIVSVEKATILNDGTLRLTLSRGLVDFPLREQEIKDLYSIARETLPKKFAKYKNKLSLYADKKPIEYYKSRYYGGKPDRTVVKEHQQYAGNFHDQLGAPLLTRSSSPNHPTKGLQNRHIALWQSHGWYYEQSLARWEWQRARIFETVEDLYAQSYVVPFLVPMLENAGAVVMLPRERDWNTREVVVDNDGGSGYSERGRWQAAPDSGFANPKASYLHGENPFRMGTARQAKTDSDGDNTASWIPNIPADGEYGVYVSYQTVANSTSAAQYEVRHNGGVTRFSVNQQMGGGTWIYLGRFGFSKGRHEAQGVFLSSRGENGSVVTADAVRFGGGMGNIERGGSTSGVPRCLEGTRYSAQWMGAPDSVYNYWGQQYRTTDDYKDDLNARSRFSNWLAGGSVFVPNIRGKNVPIELMLSVHSDAGYDKAGGNDFVGTLSICTTDHNNGRLDAGISRMASHDLADALLANAGEDIKAQYGTWRRRVLYDRNYNETREPAVPSAILEVLSHQNFGDMRYGLDPNFRFTLARSIYKTLLRYVNEMHGTKYVVQPLPPRNFKAELNSHGKAHLSWNPVKDPVEPSATPSEYILYTAIGDLDFDNGVVVKGTSCTVNIAPNQLYHFRVVAANNGGSSFPTEVLSVEYVPQSEKTVLIVNGFHRLSSPAIIDTGNQKGFDLEADAGITYGRMAGWAGRQTVFDNSRRGREGEGALGYCGRELEGKFIAGNEFNYVREHATAIHTAHKYNIVSCSSEALETGKMKLGGIDCIDLVLGLEKDDGHSLLLYKAFSQDMQKRLRSFVRDHGSLLVSGSFVGSDMRTESEQRFLADVLKLHLNGSQQGNKDGRVQGLGMTFDTWRTLNETHYAATAPDVLSPTSLASCVMKYSDGQSAAVAYSGRDYRCLTVGFPLECITDRRSRDAIMRGILNYLVK